MSNCQLVQIPNGDQIDPMAVDHIGVTKEEQGCFLFFQISSNKIRIRYDSETIARWDRDDYAKVINTAHLEAKALELNAAGQF